MNIVTPQEIFAEILGAQVISCEVTDYGTITRFKNGKVLIKRGPKVISYGDGE
jgi:hypothetical protein